MASHFTLESVREVIDLLEFHDLPVDLVAFDIENKRIVLTVAKFNEVRKAYDKVQLEFLEVSDLSVQDRNVLKIEEIYSYEMVEVGSLLRISILFLQGISEPSLTMSFCFMALRTDMGSREDQPKA